ncbi:RidA family protein [Dokdonella sp.]|uniref:RidA family protein n=1 Tax=Dokdonella sp. TaxID=2291710 RepID=UPI003C50082E
MIRHAIPLLALVLAPSLLLAQSVVRHKLPNNSTFPIAAAVEVPAGKTMVYLSGKVPSVANEKAEKNSVAAYGDTEAQTLSVLKGIEEQLKGMNLGMGDIVRMQAFLVGDPGQGGKMDFGGFMKGYSQFFGTEAQPNLPARSTMQVAALANPGFLVEIEVTAVRP